MQPDTVSARLLQRCVAWCASQQHPETAARPEHSGTNRSAGTAAVRAVTFSTTAGRATLVTGSPTHWLQADVLMYKIRNTSTPAYLSHYIRPRKSTRHLRSSTTLLLHRPTTRTHFADRAFRCSAPAVWNSVNT